jgi:predicted metal-binding membrane protein
MAALELRQPAVAHAPSIAAGLVVLISGAIQFTAWKARQLASCRETSASPKPWRYGVRHGLRCASCCANLMAILFVVGMMDLRAMAAVTAAITLERLTPTRERVAFTFRCLTPNRERVAEVIGAVVVGTGVVLIARAALH